jgi:putative endopeptidase
MRVLYLIISVMIVAAVSCSTSNVNKAIDVKNLDSTANPKNNFYGYVNNIWMKDNPIPGEFSRYGSFDVLRDENNQQVHSLLVELSSGTQKQGTINQMIADFYNSGMDSVSLEKLGTTPLNDEFIRIDKIKDKDGVLAEIARLHTFSVFPLFGIYADQDQKDSRYNIAYLYQSGLGMPDRDYYTDADKHMQEIRAAYITFIKNMLGYIGVDKNDAAKQAETIMRIETSLAKASMTRLELRDPIATYNKMSLDSLQLLAPNVNWKTYFKAIGVENPGNIDVMQTNFFKEVSNAVSEVSVDDWKTYLRWSYYNAMASYLSDNIVNENFLFYEKTLSGSENIKPRWKRVVEFTNNSLGMGLGKIYVEKYFPPQAKERMLKLVENLRGSLQERITQLTWMGDSTKQKALDKLAAITVKIGYPDKWLEYKDVEINKATLFNNVLQCSRFNMNYLLAKVNKPVDRKEWQMPPQTVNAYYNPSMNEICFPAGILQPPFFYLDADDAVNYGAIGVVIGHEITHGFDDQGRLYDKDGNLNEWWTKSDAEAFNKRAEVLVKQFDSFHVLDTIKANGSLTLGENIADLGGLSISYNAMLKALSDNNPGEIDGLTPSQRFYISYAKIWAQNIRDKEIIKRTKEDVHSLGKYRVNGPLRNISEFFTAFNVQEGDSMFLPEAERAVIW